MEITDQILTAAHEHERHFGKAPSEIYLGSRQYFDLRKSTEWIKYQRGIVQQVAGDGPQETFNGLTVFRVNAPDHLRLV